MDWQKPSGTNTDILTTEVVKTPGTNTEVLNTWLVKPWWTNTKVLTGGPVKPWRLPRIQSDDIKIKTIGEYMLNWIHGMYNPPETTPRF